MTGRTGGFANSIFMIKWNVRIYDIYFESTLTAPSPGATRTQYILSRAWYGGRGRDVNDMGGIQRVRIFGEEFGKTNHSRDKLEPGLLM